MIKNIQVSISVGIGSLFELLTKNFNFGYFKSLKMSEALESENGVNSSTQMPESNTVEVFYSRSFLDFWASTPERFQQYLKLIAILSAKRALTGVNQSNVRFHKLNFMCTQASLSNKRFFQYSCKQNIFFCHIKK